MRREALRRRRALDVWEQVRRSVHWVTKEEHRQNRSLTRTGLYLVFSFCFYPVCSLPYRKTGPNFKVVHTNRVPLPVFSRHVLTFGRYKLFGPILFVVRGSSKPYLRNVVMLLSAVQVCIGYSVGL